MSETPQKRPADEVPRGEPGEGTQIDEPGEGRGMKREGGAFLAGMFAGVLGLMVLLLNFGIAAQAHELLDECQVSLPRDQHCVIIAVEPTDTQEAA